MKQLKTEFIKNDLKYRILERTKSYYFAELRSLDTDCVHAYECGRIVAKCERIVKGKKIQANEAIVSNEQFGKHLADMAVPPTKRDKCYQHFLKYARKDQKMNINSKTNNKSKCNEAVHTN